MSELETLINLVRSNQFVVLDTETTGLSPDSEMCQLSVVDYHGVTLIDTLVKPSKPIPADAIAIHGITNEMVAQAPTIAELTPQLSAALAGRDLVIYNANYDLRIIEASYKNAGVKYDHFDWREKGPQTQIACAMEAYAEYYGDWNEYRQSYKWQRLSNACQQCGLKVQDAHNALGDCLMTLALIRYIEDALRPDPEPAPPTHSKE